MLGGLVWPSQGSNPWTFWGDHANHYTTMELISHKILIHSDMSIYLLCVLFTSNKSIYLLCVLCTSNMSIYLLCVLCTLPCCFYIDTSYVCKTFDVHPTYGGLKIKYSIIIWLHTQQNSICFEKVHFVLKRSFQENWVKLWIV